MFEIVHAAIEDPAAQRLIVALNEELSRRYPEVDARHFALDAGEVESGRGAFLIAREAGEPIGCGAVRLVDLETAEIKRMYTHPDHRGRGVARAMLLRLERIAAELGATRVVLESGVRQPDAIRLYERAGFARIAPFGEHLESALSVCMAKDLQRTSAQQRKPVE